MRPLSSAKLRTTRRNPCCGVSTVAIRPAHPSRRSILTLPPPRLIIKIRSLRSAHSSRIKASFPKEEALCLQNFPTLGTKDDDDENVRLHYDWILCHLPIDGISFWRIQTKTFRITKPHLLLDCSNISSSMSSINNIGSISNMQGLGQRAKRIARDE